jgi:hypothetical protein
MRALITIWAGLLTLSSHSHSEQQSKAKIISAYSMFAPSISDTPNIYARVIVDGVFKSAGDCPQLISGDHQLAMQIRANRPTSEYFPITVCEAKLQPNTGYRVANSSFSIAPVTLDPKKIAVFGDTGCKTAVCANNSPAEPFKSLTEQGAALKPHLLLHMGDLNYRGTNGAIIGKTYAYDAGDGGYGGPSCGINDTYYSQNAFNSPRPDIWSNWYDDFFSATKAISATAPWIFARGNHELCSRAGVGWFYFFGPGASLENGIDQQQCPFQGQYTQPPTSASAHIIIQDIYSIDLKPLSLWIMDSANACDASADNDLTKIYQQQYQTLQINSKRIESKPAWLISHRPIWGVEDPTTKDTLNIMLQKALSNTKQGKLPSQISLSIAGHMHIYQSSTFASHTGRPPQIVVGNSGVSLNNTNAFSEFSYLLDNSKAIVNQQGKFGFLMMEIDKTGAWQGNFLNEDGDAFLSCSSNVKDNKSVCITQ